MTYILQDIKKNIVTGVTPIHSAFVQANLFIDTLFDSDEDNLNNFNNNTYNNSDNSDDSDNLDDSDDCGSYSSDFDSDTHYSPNYYYNTGLNANIKKLNESIKQENFEAKVYSPINCDKKSLFQVANVNSNDNLCFKEKQEIEEVKQVEEVVEVKEVKQEIEEVLDNQNVLSANTVNKNISESEEKLIIDNLHILASVNPHQKLAIEYLEPDEKTNIDFKLYIDNSYFPQLSRWYYNQSRANTIMCVDTLINLAVELKKYYLTMNDELNEKSISSLLSNAKLGILNLAITYSNDVIQVEKLNLLVGHIDNN
jgi:hypothetical protein